MKAIGILIAAAIGLLLLTATLAGPLESVRAGALPVAGVDAPALPAWHPPVAGWPQEGSRHPALPEGHPPIPDDLVCPVTGATGKSGQAPRTLRPPVEGLVRI